MNLGGKREGGGVKMVLFVLIYLFSNFPLLSDPFYQI